MNAPAPPAAETLRTALAALLDGLPPRQAAQAVDRLISDYRGATPTNAPILRDRRRSPSRVRTRTGPLRIAG